MTKLKFDITMSRDDFIAGPNPGPEAPLGEGGERLHQWVYGLKSLPGAPRQGRRRDQPRRRDRRGGAREHRRSDHGPTDVRWRTRPLGRVLGGLVGR